MTRKLGTPGAGFIVPETEFASGVCDAGPNDRAGSTLPPVTSPASDTLSRVAGQALAEVQNLTRQLTEDIAHEIPELARDPRLREFLVGTVHASLVAALTVYTSDERKMTATAPRVALEYVRRLAQQAVPLTLLLRAFRLGQAAFQQQMIARIAAENATAAEVAAAAMELSSIAFSFIDTVSEEIIGEYQIERDNWLRQRNANRLAKVQNVLAGNVADVAETENAIGYGLSGSHVAAILWSGGDGQDSERLAGLERTAARLAVSLGCTRTHLFVAPDASTGWAWFEVSVVEPDAILRDLAEARDSVFVALGDVARGPEGFRESHLQARQAQTIALAADPAYRRRVTASSQLGPLALVAGDVTTVRGWVHAVLGELANDDEAQARLRETVWAYLASGSSLATAAAELHLHKNTIQYRLRKAEEERGKPLSENRIDLEVALLACRLLGPAVLQT